MQRVVIAGPHPLEDERIMANGSICILCIPRDAREAQRQEQRKGGSGINLAEAVLAPGADTGVGCELISAGVNREKRSSL